MSRRPRIWLADCAYHITLRGNNRQAIFAEPSDYQQYLIELLNARRRHPCRVFAFALMTNHVHLVLQALPEGNLSELMREVNGSYTRYVNGRYRRVGHLYQGRFYSNLIDREAYLLEVTRYVHLNPVRAGMVAKPEDWRWSSLSSHCGTQQDAGIRFY